MLWAWASASVSVNVCVCVAVKETHSHTHTPAHCAAHLSSDCGQQSVTSLSLIALPSGRRRSLARFIAIAITFCGFRLCPKRNLIKLEIWMHITHTHTHIHHTTYTQLTAFATALSNKLNNYQTFLGRNLRKQKSQRRKLIKMIICRLPFS